jgi:hypothetical protein
MRMEPMQHGQAFDVLQAAFVRQLLVLRVDYFCNYQHRFGTGRESAFKADKGANINRDVKLSCHREIATTREILQ